MKKLASEFLKILFDKFVWFMASMKKVFLKREYEDQEKTLGKVHYMKAVLTP